MKRTDFYGACLEKCRQNLMGIEELNDDEAFEEIVRTVFSEPGAEFEDEDSIDSVVQRIYLMTRRKLGILDPLVKDEDISEIMVNGKDKIFYEKYGKVSEYGLGFETTEDLEEVMRNIAGSVHREINELNPIVDARLEDGSRVNGVYKNVALNGPILTIRKFSDRFLTMDDLVKNGTMTEKESAFLGSLVACGYNLFISGGTSSGKTTLLNALSTAVPPEERVIVIEDSMELKLNHINNIVHMECRNANSKGKGLVTMADLIKTSLRMRPDRIIVGEVRGGEVAEMLQAMNTGHPGSMSTGHGNTAEGMLKRLEAMYLMSVSLNIDAIREQIAEGIDVMVHIRKDRNGARHISEIKEILGYESGKFILNDIMSRDSKGIVNLEKAVNGGERYAKILSCGLPDRDGGGVHIF